jgi:hypothetical protein
MEGEMAKFTSVIALTAAICCGSTASAEASVASLQPGAAVQQLAPADGRLWLAQYRPGYRPGRPHYRPRRRHHDNSGNVVAAGALGLVLGAAIASSASHQYDPPPAPLPYDQVDPYTQPYRGGDRHQYCSAKFSTYDPGSGTYLASDGRHYPCH